MAINPVQAQAQMHAHMVYGLPVMRPPSPASSVGTAYGPDATDLSDSELSPLAFERKCQERLGLLGEKRREEEAAEEDPLLTIPRGAGPAIGIRARKMDPIEEKILYERVMQNLRSQVQQLQENEVFEQTLLRGSRAALEPAPLTTNIDSLLSSMMGPSLNLNSLHSRPTQPATGSNLSRGSAGQTQAIFQVSSGSDVTPGPWNNVGKAFSRSFDSNGVNVSPNAVMDISPVSEGTISPPQAKVGGKRSRNGTSRSKRRS